MRISTTNSREVRGGDRKPVRRKAPAQKKAPQKIGRARLGAVRILASARRLGRWGGILLIAAALGLVVSRAYHSEKFRVRDIAIYGCKEVDPKVIEGIVRSSIPGSILDVELDELRERLEQVHWVRHVEIRRVLPSGLTLIIRERVPTVILEIGGRLMIADNDGTLLDAYDPRYGHLDVPVFKGVLGTDPDGFRSFQEENSARIRSALGMLAEIRAGAPAALDRISEVDISDRNNMKILLVDDTAEIYLGRNNYALRLQAFLTSGKYQELKDRNMSIAVVDLRFDDRIVYRSGPATAVSSPGGGD